MLLKKKLLLWLGVVVIGMLVLLLSIQRSESVKNLAAIASCEATSQDIDELREAIKQTSDSGGGTVSMKACLYIISNPIVLESNVHLRGAGVEKTTLTINPELEDGSINDNKLIVTEAEAKDIQISNLTVDGKKQERQSLINNPYAHTIDLATVDGFKINNIKIVNAPSASIMIYSSKNGSVKNTKILNSGSNGILALKDIENVVISDNEINNTDHQNGIFISYQEGYSSSNVTIENNIVKYAADFGIEVGHIVPEGNEQHENIEVKNNKVMSSTNSGIAFRTVSEGIIKNNVITGYGKNGGYGADGIFVEGGFNTSTNIEVINNEITQNYQSGDANAIYVTGINNAIVKGNEIEDSRGNGVFVQASVLPDGIVTSDFNEGKRNFNKVSLIENQIINNKKNGIQFQGNDTEGNSIEKNVIKGNQEFGIQIANLSPSRGFLVSENQISDNGKQSLSIYMQNDIEIVANNFNSSNSDHHSLSVVHVEGILVKDNYFNEDNWEDVFGDENNNGIVNKNNRFKNQ